MSRNPPWVVFINSKNVHINFGEEPQPVRGLSPEHYIYDVLRIEERRALRKELKRRAKEKLTPKVTTGKARVCKNCGLWIQRRRILYTEASGKVTDFGLMYIHINVRKSQHAIIERCYPEPRPIPKRTP